MIGIDTNVIVRLLVMDDARQADLATRYIKKHCSTESPALISHIVLVEVAWVLEDVYEYKRAQIATAIEALMTTAQLKSHDPSAVIAALERFRSTAADFADCLLGVTNIAAGCEYTVSFDRKASKMPEFRLIPSGS